MEVTLESTGCVDTYTLLPYYRTTTLYEVISMLQAAVPEHCDDLVVALVCQWLRSGRIRFLGDTTAA